MAARRLSLDADECPSFGKAARKAIEEANDLGDLDTADLLTEVSRGIDKWLWFVEAHQQAKKNDST